MAERVLVAMSGGVDSAAAALLLRQGGADVAGATLRLYDAPGPAARGCCSPAGVRDAARWAELLGIRHYVFDYREEFRRAVIDDFVAEYGRGRTPNPCVRCNRVVKFEFLGRQARAMGFDALATGHYVRREYDDARRRWLLRRAADAAKDQSYFLWGTPADALPALRFPLGGLTKGEVRRRLAAVAPGALTQAESQDVCFIGGGDVGAFVAAASGGALEAGPIRDEEGKLLGRHRGLAAYTVGQRRGLGVAAGARLYVKRVDRAANTLVLAPAVTARTFRLAEPNWLLAPRGEEFRVTAAIRYRDAGAPATVRRDAGDEWDVTFDRPRRALAPGQSAAFYEGDVLVGGGVIDAVSDA
jgi:tRNA-specific 2-thiouridylase